MYAHLTSFLPEKQLASLTASLLVKFDIPTIDKLTLLADLRHYERNLETLSRHNDYMDEVIDHSMHYKYRIRTASDLFIQVACPVSAPVPHLRIEFNPNKFDYRGSLWHALLPMLKNKRLTRIDYAIDYNSDLSHYQFTTERPRKTCQFNSPTGKMETLYLGTPTSTNQYRIYDKSAEMIAQGNEPLSDGPHWRIEQQFNIAKESYIHALRPFHDLTAWKPSEYTGEYIDDLVLDSLHKDSRNWSRLSPSRYRHYRNLIKDTCRVDHLPMKPVTTFQRGYPTLREFLDELLA